MRLISLITLILFTKLASGQFITGIVIDESGMPVEGAHVFWKQSQLGTLTNDQGSFRIEASAEDSDTLFISFVGYVTIERAIEQGWKGHLGELVLLQNIATLPIATVNALRVQANQPFAFQDWDESEIDQHGTAKDIPYLLQYSPSLVASSDAGNGVGYTSLRIRGSDQSRINVTINGIPYNDAESQQVFWVDLPDFSSSLSNMQIQRGLGTSTNGSGAFGGSIHLNTIREAPKASIEISNGIGSYGTRKHGINLGTGKIGNRFSFDAKLALIKSDGYIDRASSDLQSYYLSGNYWMDNGSLHALIFKGSELTYQSWYGTPQSRLENDRDAMLLHASNNGLSLAQTDNLLNSGRTYNFYTYDNQVDDYVQDHYQLHFFRDLSDLWRIRASLHLTIGEGFFEEYREEELFSDYELENPDINGSAIENTDLIRRRWLDNDFYGFVWEAEGLINSAQLNLGGGYHIYDGDHFGEIVWAEYAINQSIRQQYYFNRGEKFDFNVYAKYSGKFSSNWQYYLDLQLRDVRHRILGDDNDAQILDEDVEYLFFNPKFGISHRWNSQLLSYISYGVGNREPDRNDIVDAAGISPEPENMRDLEFGVKNRGNPYWELNAYWMDYDNQLVLTGELNDVGSPLRMNVPDSYRLGLEAIWGIQIDKYWSWSGSLNFSKNRIAFFREVLYDYTDGFDIIENIFEDTPISFSPSVIGSSSLSYKWDEGKYVQLQTKYVDKQYLDNTGNPHRSIDNYLLNDIQLGYRFDFGTQTTLDLKFSVFNVFDELYASNGYTYSYYFGDLVTENFYYPQAERHFMVNLVLKM